MACTLSNKCAKNLSKPTVLLQLIIKNVVTCFFFGTQCRMAWLPMVNFFTYIFIRFDATHERYGHTHRYRMTTKAALMHRIARQKL